MLLQEHKQLFEHTSQVKAIYKNGQRVWPTQKLPPAPPDYTEPFYFENPYSYDSIGGFENAGSIKSAAIEYSYDKTTWYTLGVPGRDELEITIPANSKVYFRSEIPNWHISGSDWLKPTGTFNMGGNIMSLVWGSRFVENDVVKTSFPTNETYQFAYVFNASWSCNPLDVSKLLLPVTTLTQACYYKMFENQTRITKPPMLPATTLSDYCYYNMFGGCTALTESPELPATTLTQACYLGMFSGCTSLTRAGKIHATTLNKNSCKQMFNNCSSLLNAPIFQPTALEEYCCNEMFNNCNKMTTAPVLPATTLYESCYKAMFQNCKSLTTAPVLPATIMAYNCYYYMFFGCNSLATAPALPATTLAGGCYYYMFYNCKSLTAAPVLPATTLVYDCYNRMFSSCNNLSYVKCLATSGIDTSNSTYYWLSNVSPTGTFVKDANATWPSGANGIPSDWSVSDE